MTPEGRVKKNIKRRLDKYESSVYYHMPVPSGFGAPSLDFVGCCRGHFFAIEAKAPGKDPSSRQEGTREDMMAAGGKVFVIDDDDSGDPRIVYPIEPLELWLDAIMDGEA